MIRRLRIPLILIAIAFASYAYFYQAGGWNQNSRFDLVRAYVEHGSASIDPYHRNTGDKACRGPKGRCVKAGPNDHYYCDKAPGASWLAVPMYAAIYGIAGKKNPSDAFLETSAYLSSLFAVALPSALAIAALYWLVMLMGLGKRESALVALAYGLATLAFPYATLYYGHQLTTALLIIGFAVLAYEKHQRRFATWQLFAAGACLGMSVVVEYPSAVPVFALSVYALTFVRPWNRLAWLAAGIAIPGLLCAAYHWVVFGGPATLPYEFSTQPHRSQGFFMGLGVPDMKALRELLIGEYRGLFFAAPWLALSVPGAYFAFRKKAVRWEAGIAAFVIVFVFWLNASLVDWQGGWAMGPRYLIPAIPFMVLLAAPLAARGLIRNVQARWALRLGAALLVAYSAYMMVLGTAVKPEVPSHIKRPYARYLSPQFAKGELAVSTQGINMPNAPRRAERKAWNLGQKLGLEGRGSLLPLWLLQLAGLVALWRWTGAGRRGAPTTSQAGAGQAEAEAPASS